MIHNLRAPMGRHHNGAVPSISHNLACRDIKLRTHTMERLVLTHRPPLAWLASRRAWQRCSFTVRPDISNNYQNSLASMPPGKIKCILPIS